MDYFLIHGDQKDAYLTIGTEALMNIVDKDPEKLTKVQIKNEHNHTMSISEFLKKIDKLKVRIK